MFLGATITKKRLFWPKNGHKKPFFGAKQCVWGLSGQLQGTPPYFEGAGLKKSVLQVLKARYRLFWSRHHQKTAFFAPKWPRNAILLPETVFFGPELAVVGPPTLFSGCWSQQNVFCQVLVQVIDCFGAAITKKTAFCSLKQRFGASVVSCRAPYPIYRVLDSTKECFATF